MTFYGEEIGRSATLQQVEIYVAEKGLFIEPQEAYDYWSKKKWMTNKGTPVKTLEACIDSINGITQKRELRRQSKEKKKKQKTNKKQDARNGVNIVLKNSCNDTHMGYMEQLDDERWKAFRTFVFKVRGRKCEICGSTTHLQVHHLHYRKALAWEYTVNEVIVVCRCCHKRIHGIASEY